MRYFHEEENRWKSKCDLCFAADNLQYFVVSIGQVHALDLCNTCTVKMWKIVTLMKEGKEPSFD